MSNPKLGLPFGPPFEGSYFETWFPGNGLSVVFCFGVTKHENMRMHNHSTPPHEFRPTMQLYPFCFSKWTPLTTQKKYAKWPNTGFLRSDNGPSTFEDQGPLWALWETCDFLQVCIISREKYKTTYVAPNRMFLMSEANVTKEPLEDL